MRDHVGEERHDEIQRCDLGLNNSWDCQGLMLHNATAIVLLQLPVCVLVWRRTGAATSIMYNN